MHGAGSFPPGAMGARRSLPRSRGSHRNQHLPRLFCTALIPLSSAQVCIPDSPRVKQTNKIMQGDLKRWTCSRFMGQSRSENQSVACRGKKRAVVALLWLPGCLLLPAATACFPPRCSSGAGSELNSLPLNIKYI